MEPGAARAVAGLMAMPDGTLGSHKSRFTRKIEQALAAHYGSDEARAMFAAYHARKREKS